MFDLAALKELAKCVRRPVLEFLALSSGNDPFWAKRDSRTRAAEWFAALWEQHSGDASHLRRFHYRLVSQTAGTVLLPDGRPYENTETDWHYLVNAGRDARYLDLISLDALIDRRNAAPLLYAGTPLDPNEERKVACTVEGQLDWWNVPDFPDLPTFELTDLEVRQNFLVEVWIEKSGENDWLVPLCKRRGVNLVVGIGEQSEIRSRELAIRSAQCDVPVRVFYLSDFDPAGRSMPKAVARKVEFTIAKLELRVDFQLIPLALLLEQVCAYGLPRTPIKEGEKRKDKFEQTFGFGATELDAMEALHPGELGRILEAGIDEFIDPLLERRVTRVERKQEKRLTEIQARVKARHENELEALRQEFDAVISNMNELWQTIAEDLEKEAPDLSAVSIPRSEAPGRTERPILFDSKRDYFTQMDAYNDWRDGCEGDAP